MDRSSYSASESERLHARTRDEDEWTGKAMKESEDGALELQLRDFSQVTGITDRGALLAMLEEARFDLQVRS